MSPGEVRGSQVLSTDRALLLSGEALTAARWILLAKSRVRQQNSETSGGSPMEGPDQA